MTFFIFTLCGVVQKRAMQFGSRIANKDVAGFLPLDEHVHLRQVMFFLDFC
jgi:hypothetical protein